MTQSPELRGGPAWPGGIGVHENGSIYVVFGNHAHRLDADLQVIASQVLPRRRPYNSFVVLSDGSLAVKDFAGSRPAVAVRPEDRQPCELLVLEPEGLAIVDRLVLPEPSIARLSADGDDIYVVGDTSLLRVSWDGSRLVLDDRGAPGTAPSTARATGGTVSSRRGAAWFLDDGDGSERYAGTLRGQGISTAPLRLMRVDLRSAALTSVEICGLPGGLIANPPVVDEARGVVVGYDSGNGVVAGFGLHDLSLRWRRDQDHASHLLLYQDTGELVTGDGSEVVILDISTGDELGRVDSGSGVQCVLFPPPAWIETSTCARSSLSPGSSCRPLTPTPAPDSVAQHVA